MFRSLAAALAIMATTAVASAQVGVFPGPPGALWARAFGAAAPTSSAAPASTAHPALSVLGLTDRISGPFTR